MWCTSATRPGTTAQSFPLVQPQSYMGRAGIIRPTSVPQCGMAGHTPTEWELGSPIPQPRAGVSASVTAMATIPGITLGGDRWVTTDAAGIRITDGVHGAEQPWPTFMACGVTLLIREPERLGRIHTPAITELPAAVLTTTLRRGAPLSLVAAQIPTFTLATPTATVAERPTIQTPELLPGAAQATRATSTPGR